MTVTTEYQMLSEAPLEMWEIEKLKPYGKNNKKHDKKSVEELAKSIAEVGVENPILIEEDGTIISGHGRREALILLGKTHAHVRVARGLTKIQCRKLRIAANKTVSTAYDSAAMAEEVRELAAMDIDLSGMGLTDREFEGFLTDIGEIDVDILTDDIVASVEEHEERIEEIVTEVEASEMPIAKAFGIKKVPTNSVRTITRFMGEIEAKTGKEGVEALIEHMDAVLKGA